MRVRNSEGQAVDPVPFLVCVGLTALGCFSFVPAYCLSFGLSVRTGLALATLLFVVGSGLVYHRLVWAARPDYWQEVPATERLRTLFYVALVVVGVLVLASLPFYVR